MNRIVTLILALTLAGCSQIQVSVLPPEEVIASAARVVQAQESARVNLDVHFSYSEPLAMKLSGRAKANGVLQSRGEQTQLTVDLAADLVQQNVHTPVEAMFDIIRSGQTETYVRVQKISSGDQLSLVSMLLPAELMNTWIRLPGATSTGVVSTVAPDPALLRSQINMLRVVEDKGIHQALGSSVYKYKVAFDTEKTLQHAAQAAEHQGEEFRAEELERMLVAASPEGELWIDAETFVLRKIQWTIDTFTDAQGREISGSFTVRLDLHNEAAQIDFPSEVFELPGAEYVPLIDEEQAKEDNVTEAFLSDEENEILEDDTGTSAVVTP